MMRLAVALVCCSTMTLAIQADDASKAVANPDSAGFVQLFNGKDLSGWITHPNDKDTKWEVVDGAITASGGKAGHLFSERGDYHNFIYRVEAMINEKGNSGQFFRTKFGKSFPQGYEAQINYGQSDPIRTGSLYPSFMRNKSKDEQNKIREKIIVKKANHKPNEWFTQEVTAIGNHIVIKVNGVTQVDFVDEGKTFDKGHFAIQYHDPTCKIKVRKVEVKELPAEAK